MNILRWLLLAGIPCAVILNVAGNLMTIQHWPGGREIVKVSIVILLIILIAAWVFALRYRSSHAGSEFDSI